MGSVMSHRDLTVWQKSMDMAVQVCELCKQLPKDELYGLTTQLRRVAVSVPANIAEGNARGTSKDYSRFLSIAKGSLVEADTFLTLAIRLSYLETEAVQPTFALITEIGKMLTVMRAKLGA